jgi:hypothetical protein
MMIAKCILICLLFPNGSDQWLAAHRLAITNRHARESIASRGSGRPIDLDETTTAQREMLPGRQGGTQSRPARRLRPRSRLTRATTDLHRQAPSARAASGALSLLRPSRPLRAGSPSGPSAHNAAPPPSLSFRTAELRPPDRGREGMDFPRRGRERSERQG